jgi:hypothetical protein
MQQLPDTNAVGASHNVTITSNQLPALQAYRRRSAAKSINDWFPPHFTFFSSSTCATLGQPEHFRYCFGRYNRKRIMESNSTLFDRLGSVDAVKAAVEELYQRLLADEQTAPFFESVPMARLKVRCPYAVNIFFADYY